MLDNNVNNKQQLLQFRALSPQQAAQQQVAMQAVNPELLKENVQDSYVANRIGETAEDPKGMMYTAALTVPTWFAIAKGMDVYANRSRGDFENTVHHKVGQFGDDVTNYVKNSSFGKSSFATSINNGFKSFKGFLKKNFVDRFRITRAMAYTPSRPELDMVKGQANGMWGMQLFDYPQHGEQFVKPLQSVEDLDCYGASKKDIAKWKGLLDKASTPQAKAEIMQRAELETILQNSRLKRTPAQIAKEISDFKALGEEAKILKLKDMKAFEWGYKDFAEMEAVAKNIQEKMPRVLEACHDANPKMFARIWGTNHSAWGRFKTWLIGREVYASETANKIAGSLGNVNLAENKELVNVLQKTGLDKKIPKSILGKFLAKYNNLVLEGATNRVAGGKFVALMQAAYLADVLYKTAKVDGASEKVKTFAERFTEMIAFFVAMPLAIQLMHRVGGLQYAGMTKDQVEKYRQHLKIHNDKAMAGGFADKSAWKASKDALKTELNAGVKNPITKLFKRIGRIVTVGLEQIRPYDKKAVTRNGIVDKIKDLFRHPKFGIKQMAGYPMRIILGMMVILPFLSKIAVKGSHLLFGKPQNSVLDEGKEDKMQAQAINQQLQLPPQLQQPLNQPQQTTAQTTTTTTRTNQNSNISPSNLLNPYKNGSTTTTTTTTKSSSSLENKPQEPVRTYIPSPVGVQIQNKEDLTAADAAMRRADLAEQQALQTLKMN
ncbi:unknown [Clostridium sp. CAG:768]|nr:unknown [Clostridium sp. CAG:768]